MDRVEEAGDRMARPVEAEGRVAAEEEGIRVVGRPEGRRRQARLHRPRLRGVEGDIIEGKS
jgi:hypothetical protein